METENKVLKEAIKRAYKGVTESNLGTQERKDASDELNEFYKLDIDELKARNSAELEKEKLEAERKKVEEQIRIEEAKLKAEKLKNEREAYAKDRQLEFEREKAQRQAEIDMEKLKAEKEAAERDARLKQEQMKADDKKDKRNVGVKICQLVGVVLISGLMLITDSENWIGKRCAQGANFVTRFLKL